MIHSLYDIISIYVISGVLILGGLAFLFIAIPRNPLLDSYRKARVAMSFAYLFFAAVNMVEFLFRGDGNDDIRLMQTVTLAVAFSQAFLFTFALTALINVRWIERRRFIRELMLVLVYIGAVFYCYFRFPAAFNVFTGLYFIQLIRYIRLFVINYRQFRLKMDNYFSGTEKQKMVWVAVSFFLALAIGIIALITGLFPTVHTVNISSVVYLLFYGWFAIRFINYPFVFDRFEEALADDTSGEALLAGKSAKRYAADTAKMEQLIDDWIRRKMYTKPNVSVAELTRVFGVNRYYISKYINEHEHCNFNEWINGLRIREAKRLLQESPDRSISDIAVEAGFSSSAYFGVLFLKSIGQTPQQWRNAQR